MTIVKTKKFKKYSFLFLIGLLSSFAFAPLYLFPILFLGFFFLLNELQKSKDKKAGFLVGWCFGLGYFLGGTYWSSISMLVDFKKYGWFMPFSLTLFPGFLAIYLGLTSLFTYLFIKKTKLKSEFLFTTVFACFWILLEYLREILFTGFPWNPIGQVWCFSDIMLQAVSVVGIYGLGFLTILLFSSLFVLRKNKSDKIFELDKGQGRVVIGFYIVLVLVIFLFGWVRLNNSEERYVENVKVRLVQPNIKQDLKWEDSKRISNILEHIKLSKSEGFEEITHIIWPETAISYNIQNNNLLLKDLKRLLLDNDKVLITGGLRVETDESYRVKGLFNSLYVIKGHLLQEGTRGSVISGQWSVNSKVIEVPLIRGKRESVRETEGSDVLQYYDKSHLVPFGEFFPFRKLFPYVAKITHGNMDFSSGPGPKTLEVDGFPVFSPLICYEIIFSEKVIDYKNQPDLIINITNDSWFGESSGPYQHFDFAKIRAVETGIPVIRVANGGISGVLDGYGRVIKRMGLNKKGIIDSKIPKKISVKALRRNVYVLVLCIFYLGLIFLFFSHRGYLLVEGTLPILFFFHLVS